MGLETENPVEFLSAAKSAIAEYETLKSQLEQQKETERQTGSSLEKIKKEVSDKIDRTIKTRSAEINATYDKQISQIDARLKKANADRDRAKREGVKGRISAETEPYIIENKELKRQIKAIMQKDNAPAFCCTNLFFTLFRPSGISELFRFLLFFIAVFALLPFGLYSLIPDRKIYYLIGIYILDIAIFGGLYLAIFNITIGRHQNAIHEGREIKNRIKTNRKKIRLTTHAIEKDSNEDGYNLESFDDEISKIQQERNDAIAQKQSAQNTFDTVTKNILTDEIENAYRAKIEELTDALRAAGTYRSQLETKENESALRLSQEYGQYLGKSHMNDTDIERIHEMITSGAAASIVDAVAKIDHPESASAT
jgi:hypothetical protein